MRAVRIIAYLLATALSLVIYLLHKQWLSWLVLITVVLLPAVSLLISLPAMLTAKAQLKYPTRVRLGMPAKVTLVTKCPFPLAKVDCRLRLQNTLSGERYVGTPGEYIPTEHCGVMEIVCDRLWVWDCLGLFRRKLKTAEPGQVYIEPKPVAGELPELAGNRQAALWVPKPGGGFSENHELRLYRPGDDLRNIHWKLSRKTGKLIYREAMEPAQKQMALVLTLSGDADELDRKLGVLLDASNRLLTQQKHHRVHCCSGSGIRVLDITDPESQQAAMDALLRSTPTVGEWIPQDGDADLRCLIGGDDREE